LRLSNSNLYLAFNPPPHPPYSPPLPLSSLCCPPRFCCRSHFMFCVLYFQGGCVNIPIVGIRSSDLALLADCEEDQRVSLTYVYAATRCNTLLQRTATYCNLLTDCKEDQRVSLTYVYAATHCYTLLQYTASHCSKCGYGLRGGSARVARILTRRNMLQQSATHCNTPDIGYVLLT